MPKKIPPGAVCPKCGGRIGIVIFTRHKGRLTIRTRKCPKGHIYKTADHTIRER